MNFPLVSVVMPVYNAEKYLKEAIDSILSQTYPNFELVVVNDGSTDSSREIILSYADPRIRLIENEKNSGIVFTRNVGLMAAAGVYTATLDSDDIAVPDRLTRQVNFLETNLTHGMCGSFYTVIDGKGQVTKKVEFPVNHKDIITHLTINNCFCNSTILVRSPLAKELKYREQYDIVEDYELWYRISKRAELANLPFYGTYYRVHGNNISVSKMNDMFERVKKINHQILIDSEITFSERELELHARFLRVDLPFFGSADVTDELENWVCKFYEGLTRLEKYNQGLLFDLITERWLIIAFKTKKFRKLFSNRLKTYDRKNYLKNLKMKVAEKLLNRTAGS